MMGCSWVMGLGRGADTENATSSSDAHDGAHTSISPLGGENGHKENGQHSPLRDGEEQVPTLEVGAGAPSSFPPLESNGFSEQQQESTRVPEHSDGICNISRLSTPAGASTTQFLLSVYRSCICGDGKLPGGGGWGVLLLLTLGVVVGTSRVNKETGDSLSDFLWPPATSVTPNLFLAQPTNLILN